MPTTITITTGSPGDEQTWNELRTWLLPLVQNWVYYSGVMIWHEQQREISEEITHEAITRTFSYCQRALHREGGHIVSLKALCKKIALNHFLDCRRREKRLVHLDTLYQGDQYTLTITTLEHIDPVEIALEQLQLESTFTCAARVVAKFAPKRRRALLTDLANMTDFDGPPSLLERALAKEGIQLRDYHRPLPDDLAARNRHAALLYMAYRQLRNEMKEQ